MTALGVLTCSSDTAAGIYYPVYFASHLDFISALELINSISVPSAMASSGYRNGREPLLVPAIKITFLMVLFLLMWWNNEFYELAINDAVHWICQFDQDSMFTRGIAVKGKRLSACIKPVPG